MTEKDLSLKKLPPNNADAEKCVLGSILINNSFLMKIIGILNPDDFYYICNQKIYSTMLKLFNDNITIELVILSEELQKSGNLETIGGTVYLMGLMEATPTATAALHHAKIIREKSTLRKMIAISTQINLESYGEQVESTKLLYKAEQLLMDLSEKEIKSDFQSTSDLMPNCFEMVEHIYEKKGALTGLSTGFSDLDELTSGLQKSDMIVIAARPSVGKTSLGLNIATHLAIKENTPVAIFSLETSKQQLILRMLCSEARVNSHALKRGYLREDDWPKLTRAAGALSNCPIYIDDTSSISPIEMRAKLRQLIAKQKDLGLVIVDYLQLMSSGMKKENRQQEITYISSSVKSIGRELNIPFIAICQLSRLVERRKPPRPILSDIRESGSVEQDSDVVMFLYGEDYGKENQDDKSSVTDLIIAKNRNGPLGTVKLLFKKSFTRFEEITPDWVEESVDREGWGT